MHDRGEGEHRFYGAPGRICGEDRHRAARMRGATSRAAQAAKPARPASAGRGVGDAETQRNAPSCSPSGCCALALRVETAWGWTGEGNPTTLYEGEVFALTSCSHPPPGGNDECSVTAFINDTAVARERVCVCTAAQPVHLPKKGRFTVGRRCPSEAAFHLSKSARKKSQRIIDLSAGRAWRFSAPPLQRGAPAFAARVASARARAGR